MPVCGHLWLLRYHHEWTLRAASWLTIGCPLDHGAPLAVILVVELDRSLRSVLHRVRFLAILVTAAARGVMHVEVGSCWQTSTFDLGAEEFTHWIICQLLNGQLVLIISDEAAV